MSEVQIDEFRSRILERKPLRLKGGGSKDFYGGGGGGGGGGDAGERTART